MSVSAPQAPQAQPQGPRPLATSAATRSFPDLHSLAADIVSDLQALTTGLAHSGAAAPVVQRISQMTGLMTEVAHTLSQGPPIPNPAHAPAPQQAQPAPQQAQPQQPQPQQGQPARPQQALAQAVSALAKHAADNAAQQH